MPLEKKIIPIQLRSVSTSYKIEIGSDILKSCGEWARSRLNKKEAAKVAVISNPTIYKLYGGIAVKSLESAGFRTAVWLMKDGERHKDLRSLASALKFFNEMRLSRSDAVVALGGGVVGDLAGFASAVHLRGISFLQIPTTFLAMIDSSVGGKTAVNSAFGKNLIGAFHQPAGVLIDISVLKTLPRREVTAGLCEAVKQGAVSSRVLFNKTGDFLQKYPPSGFRDHFEDTEFTTGLASLIESQVAFKAMIVRQDERESTSRNDAKSRKILNFGHTLAHALEKITKYKYFKHGEAVGYGVIFAAELSKILEILPQDDLELLNDVVHRTGKLPEMPDIDPREILDALKTDKKSVAESVNWILLKGIGKPVILSDKDVPRAAVNAALKKIRQN